MINYSIVKRSVNANLLAINQAMSRIILSKKEGKNAGDSDGQGSGSEGGQVGF